MLCFFNDTATTEIYPLPLHDALPILRGLGGVLVAEEEDLAGVLLAHLAGEVRRAETAVEAADVGVGLLEPRVLGAGQREVRDDVQAVPAAGGPPGDDAQDDLGHEADQPLRLER